MKSGFLDKLIARLDQVEPDVSVTVTSAEDGNEHYIHVYTAPLKRRAAEP